MRRIPTAEQKEELKRLLKQQYEDTVASIDRDEGLDPACADWSLSDEIEKTRKQIYEEIHIGKRSCGWTGETYDEWERKRGHYPHSLVPATSMSPPLAFASPEMRISADE